MNERKSGGVEQAQRRFRRHNNIAVGLVVLLCRILDKLHAMYLLLTAAPDPAQ
jgi:hypothetical protein